MQDDLRQWQLQGSGAELYERYLVPAVTRQWAIDLVARVGVRRAERVLDVACGTGVAARVAAEHVGRSGRVAGLDLNSAMLAVARSSPEVGGVPIEWHEGSALALPFDDGAFTVVLCQFGLQFFPDPLLALAEMRRVLVPQGRAAASVFAALERNPVAHAFSDALDQHLGDGASAAKRSEHALADADEFGSLFREAGFAGIQIDTVAKTSRYPSVSEYVQFQLRATPLADLIKTYAQPERDRLAGLVADELAASVPAFVHDREFAFPQLAHVATAHAH